jgi:tRNA threonylcarbamoyl adenosine modification protein (Sua5/YciO/YrdC/YwlC family)
LPRSSKAPRFASGIDDAVEALRAGLLVVYPTDTFYAVGADAFSRAALKRLFAAKARNPAKPVALIAADTEMAFSLFAETSWIARRLADVFWPGPLTIAAPARDEIARELVGPDGGVGVRVPAHQVARELSERLEGPITATSANLAGGEPARTLAEARRALRRKVKVYLEGGTLEAPAPSTVVTVRGDDWRILRDGAIARSEIAAAVASGVLK